MKSSILSGKKILMFSPFGSCIHYTRCIVNELYLRGADVHLYDERPSQSSLAKTYMYLFRKYAPGYFFKYIKTIAIENKTYNPDIVFIVRGQGFDESILSFLKDFFNKSVFVFYQWDPLRGRRIEGILKYYNYSFTFDRLDATINPEFVFRPTFYMPDYKIQEEDKKDEVLYDVCFVGTLYGSRLPVIEAFKRNFKEHVIRGYFYLYVSGWPRYLWEFVFRGVFLNPRKVTFTPMNYLENIAVVKKSKSILDIVYSKQSGLSMRAFEAMASQKKYITTNPEVKRYDFYNPNNILIVDINNPNVPKSFLDSPFEIVDTAVLYKYSIEGFIDDVFERIIFKQ